MTTKTRVINYTYLQIDRSIKHWGIYKEVEWNERERAREDRVQVFAECLYYEDAALLRVYQRVKLTRCEQWRYLALNGWRRTSSLRSISPLFESKELLSFIILNSKWRVWPWCVISHCVYSMVIPVKSRQSKHNFSHRNKKKNCF